MAEFSEVVAAGMKRVCNDFSEIVRPLGFKKGKNRSWVRQIGQAEETIYVSRSGATYGPPYSASINLQVALASRLGIDGQRQYLDHHTTGRIRRSTGYCYHHRFNAATNSTYDRCVEELGLFMTEVAEPWFAELRARNVSAD